MIIRAYLLFFREHDKNPESFFKVLIQLHETGCDFRLSVLGENYKDNPGIPKYNCLHLDIKTFVLYLFKQMLLKTLY